MGECNGETEAVAFLGSSKMPVCETLATIAVGWFCAFRPHGIKFNATQWHLPEVHHPAGRDSFPPFIPAALATLLLLATTVRSFVDTYD